MGEGLVGPGVWVGLRGEKSREMNPWLCGQVGGPGWGGRSQLCGNSGRNLRGLREKGRGGEDPGAEDLTARRQTPAPRTRNARDKERKPEQPGKQQESGPGRSGQGGRGASPLGGGPCRQQRKAAPRRQGRGRAGPGRGRGKKRTGLGRTGLRRPPVTIKGGRHRRGTQGVPRSINGGAAVPPSDGHLIPLHHVLPPPEPGHLGDCLHH